MSTLGIEKCGCKGTGGAPNIMRCHDGTLCFDRVDGRGPYERTVWATAFLSRGCLHNRKPGNSLRGRRAYEAAGTVQAVRPTYFCVARRESTGARLCGIVGLGRAVCLS